MRKLFTFILLTASIGLSKSNAQIYGCTDPLATNYNFAATDNDATCVYPVTSLAPVTSFNLDASISETSGLISWNGNVWTHNDNTDNNIYALDTLNGNIVQPYPINGVVNYDWEEISQDSNYIYIGDFGNNGNGNRTDLKILRIEKTSVLANAPIVDTINFSYSDQIDFTPTGGNNTDFDCESFVVSDDSIFLFTKQWVSHKTVLYSLPKFPGTYSATRKSEFDVQGLITGATYLEDKKLVVLCAYTNLLQPFVYLLYDFTGHEFFSGNKRMLTLSLPFHQVEGICTTDGLKYYVSNEAFVQAPFINTPQKLHIFDMSSFLNAYLYPIVLSSASQQIPTISVYPIPAKDIVSIERNDIRSSVNYSLVDQFGQVVSEGNLSSGKQQLDVSRFSSGIYFLKLENEGVFKIIKK